MLQIVGFCSGVRLLLEKHMRLLSDPLTSALPSHFLFPGLCTGAHLLIQTAVHADGAF